VKDIFSRTFWTDTICFSLAGGMKGADIGVGWVDQQGKVHFQVSEIFLLFYISIDLPFF
jgi:hypothetical protein